MRFIKLLFIILLFTIEGYAQNQPLGGRSAGLAGTSVTLTDIWSTHNNQAALAEIEHIAAGFYYENRFAVNELSLKSGAFVLPVKNGAFGVNLSYFGYSQYNEQKIGLAYGRKLGKYFSAGLQLDYQSVSIGENYGSAGFITFELGLYSKITDDFVIGAHVYNPSSVKLSNELEEKTPAIFKLGMAYSFSDELCLSIETEKNTNYKPLIRGGLEYDIIKKLSVRIGYSTIPSTTSSEKFNISSLYSFGFGLNLKALKINFASSIHQTLGWSPQVSLSYNFN
jgi:hypothetical protein